MNPQGKGPNRVAPAKKGPKVESTSAPRRRATSPTPSVESRYKTLGRIFDRHDLPELPKPQPLIEDCLELLSVVMMPGDTGTNKTFVATIGWACSIATGTPWLGREICIEPSPVLLVVGEGEHGLDARISAWESDSGVDVPRGRIKILVRPDLSAEGDGWEELAQFSEAEGIRFIVLDTMSSLIPSIDETNDVAELIAALHNITARINGTIVLLHHTGWSSPNRARGGTQLEQNADAVTVLRKIDSQNPETSPVELWRKKVKDGPSGARMVVERVPSGNSCVLKEVGGTRARSTITHAELIREILDFLELYPLEYTKAGAQGKLLDLLTGRTGRNSVRAAWDKAEGDGLIRARQAKGTEGKARSRWERVPSEEVPATPLKAKPRTQPRRRLGARRG